jgi:hypothetical protein
MEHVVKMRILGANTAKPQREEHFYRAPLCKTTTKTRIEKTNVECQRNAETEKHYGTRGGNATFGCQHCKTTARRAII